MKINFLWGQFIASLCVPVCNDLKKGVMKHRDMLDGRLSGRSSATEKQILNEAYLFANKPSCCKPFIDSLDTNRDSSSHHP